MQHLVIRMCTPLLASVLSLFLSSCFEGDRSSYPHDESQLINVLPIGTYIKTFDNKSSDIEVSMNRSFVYTFFDNGKTLEAGFYPNSDTTYLMYLTEKNENGQYHYFLAQPTKNKGLYIYETSKAAASLLNQVVGQEVANNLYAVPFTVGEANKIFFQRLGQFDLREFGVVATLTPKVENDEQTQLNAGEVIVEKVDDGGHIWNIIIDKNISACIARHHYSDDVYISIHRENDSYYLELFYKEWKDEKGVELSQGAVFYPWQGNLTFLFKDGSSTLSEYQRKHKTLVATIYDSNSTRPLAQLPSKDRIFRGEPFALRYTIQDKPILGGWMHIPPQAVSKIDEWCEK